MRSEGWVAEVTGVGRSALHGIMIGGVPSAAWLKQCFRGAGDSPHGSIHDQNGEVIDDVVLLQWPGSESRHLITLHGSPLLSERIVQRFEQLGAVRRDSVDELWPTTISSAASEIAQQALTALPNAPSVEVATFLLEQASPDGLAGWVERAAVNFPSRDEIESMLDRSAIGIGVLQPPTVVIAGVPNAGKSTLFNLLVGDQRTLTSSEPGTTRDLIDAPANFRGFPILLVDGAGLREVQQSVEREGVRRMRQAMLQADLVLHLIPPSQAGTGADSPQTTPCRTLVFHSRRDEDRAMRIDGPAISAVTGEGIDELKDLVLTELYGVERIPSLEPILFLASQRRILEDAIEALDAGETPSELGFGIVQS
jgi:tRNA U34 5-carboxymethylaminomethyl modifying GTPase MnmE/TrmE